MIELWVRGALSQRLQLTETPALKTSIQTLVLKAGVFSCLLVMHTLYPLPSQS